MSTTNASTTVLGLFWPIVFVCLFFTGNCSMCGGDRNYVGEYLDAKKDL